MKRRPLMLAASGLGLGADLAGWALWPREGLWNACRPPPPPQHLNNPPALRRAFDCGVRLVIAPCAGTGSGIDTDRRAHGPEVENFSLFEAARWFHRAADNAPASPGAGA